MNDEKNEKVSNDKGVCGKDFCDIDCCFYFLGDYLFREMCKSCEIKYLYSLFPVPNEITLYYEEKAEYAENMDAYVKMIMCKRISLNYLYLMNVLLFTVMRMSFVNLKKKFQSLFYVVIFVVERNF